MQSEAEKRPELEDLIVALGESPEALADFLGDTHAADLAEWVVELDDEDIARVLACLETEDRSELLEFADDIAAEKLLKQLSVDEIVQVVEQLPADEVVDLLALTDDESTEMILRTVDFDRSQGLRRLALYDEETAGGLMTVDYVHVPETAHVGDAIKVIRTEEGPAAEEEGGVFVVDDAGCPVGYVSDRDLLTTPIHTPISEVMETDLITVHADDDQEEVAQLVHKYSFAAVPVVDSRGRLIGSVSDEDALEVLQEEAEEDIMRLVGTSAQGQVTRLPVMQRVKSRIPLQVLTVVGGLVTAEILAVAIGTEGSREAGSGSAVDVLRYLPIIIGLAGNVGIQSATILVRAFATGEVGPDRERDVLVSEVQVGLVIGTICGVLTGVVASMLESSLLFGGAVGCAVTVAVVWAALLGGVVPLVCQRRGVDPAIVAGPFLITLSDISGAAIFIGIANLALGFGG